MTKAKSLMILGTASSVGKSFIAAAFCRLFSDWGYKVAPFKAQNMSNNSYVTEAGGEIGRAQAVQAECARVKPHTDMNPILLKPSGDNSSQVIVQGKAVGTFKAREYYNQRDVFAKAIQESYGRLAAENDIIVIEGAGSAAEINLKPYDLVNLHTAKMADAQCLLVADIDRGGVFASLLGTLDLLEPEEQARITGFLINKFRGDLKLFDEGVRFLEEKSGKKVWGVLPYERHLWIEEEDGVAVEQAQAGVADKSLLDIAVLHLPRISNFTDFEVLRQEPSVNLRYVKKASELGNPDLLILPGTKATVADFLYLIENGFREAILNYVEKGGRLLGICGGYQMMGDWILDPSGMESSSQKTAGFGLFKMTTEFQSEKVLRRVEEPVEMSLWGRLVKGTIDAYEIHMGTTRHDGSYIPFGREGAIHSQKQIAGTYYHGLFDSGDFRKSFLDALAAAAGKQRTERASLSVQEIKEIHYNKLREMLESHIDLNQLRSVLGLTALRHS